MKDLLTLDEVAKIANVSKPTIYRRVKHNGFPKPIKVPRAGDRGPKTVNRWERGQVMGWLMKGNDPQWNAYWEGLDTDHEPRGFWNNHILLALIGGVAAAAAYALVNG